MRLESPFDLDRFDATDTADDGDVPRIIVFPAGGGVPRAPSTAPGFWPDLAARVVRISEIVMALGLGIPLGILAARTFGLL